jgi:error-prone DNA polymerase
LCILERSDQWSVASGQFEAGSPAQAAANTSSLVHLDTRSGLATGHRPLTASPRPLVTLWSVRLGFNYLKGLRRETAARIVDERSRGAFTGIRDLVRRVSGIRKEELDSLAEAGALNFIEKGDRLLCPVPHNMKTSETFESGQSALSPFPIHRRDALWLGELAMRPVGELIEPVSGPWPLAPGLFPPRADDDCGEPSPLLPMSPVERLAADYRITGLTIGAHPMRMHRERMNRLGVTSAADLVHLPDGRRVRIAGAVICRQRPGTANGFVFLSIEDETGISNAIVLPDLFEARKLTIVEEPFLLVEGVLQNQRGSASVKAARVEGLRLDAASAGSHDFH